MRKLLLLLLLLPASLLAQTQIGGSSGSGISALPGEIVATSQGVKLNWIVLTPGSLFTITSGSSNFAITGGPGLTQADVGKQIFATTWGGADNQYVSSASCMPTATATTIATVTSGTTGTLSQNATGNCGTTNGNVGAIAYGTDDTAAWHTAKVAALDGTNCVGLIGAGMTNINNGEFMASACIGSGVGSTGSHYGGVYGPSVNSQLMFLIPPWFNTTTCTGGSSVNVCFGTASASGWNNVTFNGLGGNTYAGTGSKILFGTSTDGAYQNLIFEGICAAAACTGIPQGFTTLGGAHVHYNLIMDGSGSNPCNITSTAYSAYAWYCGNGGGSNQLVVTNTTFECFACGYQPTVNTSGTVNVTGAGGTYLEDEGVYVAGTAAGGSVALLMGANTKARLKNSLINNGGGPVLNQAINVGAGANVAVSSSFVVGGATGPAVVVAATGTYLDDTHTTYSTPSGLLPTCSTTGLTQTACTAQAGSTNERGVLRVTAGGVGGAFTMTLTFVGTYQINGNPSPCQFFYANTGSASWTAPTLLTLSSKSTTAETVAGTATTVNASTYDMLYSCPAQ